jgi:hypothetical protein
MNFHDKKIRCEKDPTKEYIHSDNKGINNCLKRCKNGFTRKKSSSKYKQRVCTKKLANNLSHFSSAKSSSLSPSKKSTKKLSPSYSSFSLPSYHKKNIPSTSSFLASSSKKLQSSINNNSIQQSSFPINENQSFINNSFRKSSSTIKVYSPDAYRRSRLSLHPASGPSGSFNHVETTRGHIGRKELNNQSQHSKQNNRVVSLKPKEKKKIAPQQIIERPLINQIVPLKPKEKKRIAPQQITERPLINQNLINNKSTKTIGSVEINELKIFKNVNFHHLENFDPLQYNEDDDDDNDNNEDDDNENNDNEDEDNEDEDEDNEDEDNEDDDNEDDDNEDDDNEDDDNEDDGNEDDDIKLTLLCLGKRKKELKIGDKIPGIDDEIPLRIEISNEENKFLIEKLGDTQNNYFNKMKIVNSDLKNQEIYLEYLRIYISRRGKREQDFTRLKYECEFILFGIHKNDFIGLIGFKLHNFNVNAVHFDFVDSSSVNFMLKQRENLRNALYGEKPNKVEKIKKIKQKYVLDNKYLNQDEIREKNQCESNHNNEWLNKVVEVQYDNTCSLKCPDGKIRKHITQNCIKDPKKKYITKKK